MQVRVAALLTSSCLFAAVGLGGCIPNPQPGAANPLPPETGPTPAPSVAPGAPVYSNPSAPPGTMSHGPYPFVLAHGMFGFKSLGPLEYFYGVAEALRKDGHVVYAGQVDALNSSAKRGEQLSTFIDGVLAETHAAKVNLICHSQGGFDCRYVASMYPAKVASVTTIATPHFGDPVADLVLKDVPAFLQPPLETLVNALGSVIDVGQSNGSQDVKASLDNLSTAGATAFGALYRNSPSVAYFSIAGRSNASKGGPSCESADEPKFISRWSEQVDQIDALLLAGGILFALTDAGAVNDGLVPVASAKWGTFLGCIPADHIGEIGLLPGTAAGPNNSFDYLQFYRDLATYLVGKGF